MSRHFSIISAGPGHSGLLTEDAREAILSAEEVYTCGRVAGALAALRADWRLCPAETLAEIASESQKEQVALRSPSPSRRPQHAISLRQIG